jgi:hypothetical protein
MADDANPWDWRKNLPPNATAMSVLGLLPGMQPVTEVGVPGSTPNMVRPYTANPVNPDTGPGYAPAVTAPATRGTAMDPPLLGFGSPTAVAGKPETEAEAKARILKSYLENKDFMGGLAAIAKGAGGKGAPTPHPMQMSGMSMGHGLPDLKGAGGQLMAKALADMAAVDLTKPIQRKSASGAQARYDILGRRQTQDLSELFKNLV